MLSGSHTFPGFSSNDPAGNLLSVLEAAGA